MIPASVSGVALTRMMNFTGISLTWGRKAAGHRGLRTWSNGRMRNRQSPVDRPREADLGQAPWWRNERGEWYVLVQGILMILGRAARGFDRLAWGEPWSMASIVAGDVLIIAGIVLGVAAVVR